MPALAPANPTTVEQHFRIAKTAMLLDVSPRATAAKCSDCGRPLVKGQLYGALVFTAGNSYGHPDNLIVTLHAGCARRKLTNLLTTLDAMEAQKVKP